VSAGGRTVWGNPSEVGSVVGGEVFDAVLDNNGKDLETVRFVELTLVLKYLQCLSFRHRKYHQCSLSGR